MTDTPVEEQAAPVETDPVREAVLAQLTGHLGTAVVGSHIAKGDLWVRVANGSWHDAISYCKTVMGFRFFAFLAVLDWLNNTNLPAETVWDAADHPVPPRCAPPGPPGHSPRVPPPAPRSRTSPSPARRISSTATYARRWPET